jgi:hypothetical protein
MATFNLAFATRIDGVGALQTFVPNGIGEQDSVVVTGAPASLSGTQTVISTEPYEFVGVSDEGDLLFNYDIIRENQFLFFSAGSDSYRDACTGTVTLTETCTWITNQMVLDWLGISPATANDTAFVTVCTEAANALAYRRRKSANYTDSLSTVPSADVKLGTIMYAGGLYRSRGAAGYDTFSTYEAMATAQPNVAMGEILRLWGCNRAVIA